MKLAIFDSLSREKQKILMLLLEGEKRSLIEDLENSRQLHRLLDHPAFSVPSFMNILDILHEVNQFYREIGGVLGYQKKALSLLEESLDSSKGESYHPPQFIDISRESNEAKKAYEKGIDALDFFAEIVPLGGAADRLHLVDDESKEELPAAKLSFLGISLLERIIRDIEARENLFFEKTGKKITTPIAMMTSMEKKNHLHILKMLEAKNYFGRPKESFRLFLQPLVPVLGENGDWILTEDFKLVLKPGGHGVLWKAAIASGIFKWFKGLGKTKAIVRQINNPIAGLDYGLLAFQGIGFSENKKFGFASCPRLVSSAEGVNVLIEKKGKITLSNIEYCDFKKFGIEDLPLEKGSSFSRFSSNTNLLFVDLNAIEEAVKKCPFPGLLINMKMGSFVDKGGARKRQVLGRLESTMQNIADVFEEPKTSSLQTKETFITYNLRHKTISTTKKAYAEGKPLQETPEACLYDFVKASRELLERCHFNLPSKKTVEEMTVEGPEFLFKYHPALGPIYERIQKKLQNGSFSQGSELELELSDCIIQNLNLDGSFRALAENITFEKKAHLELQNVSVKNRGVLWSQSKPYWKGSFKREEECQIILKGRSKFIAKDVVLEGPFKLVIEDGMCMRVSMKNHKLQIDLEPF